MKNEDSQIAQKKVYQAPMVTRVHLDPVKDLLAQCLKADQICGNPDAFLS